MHPPLSRGQALLGVSRSSLYYRPRGASDNDLSLMQAMDRQYLENPFYGSRRMKAWLERRGIPVSRKRVQRLMRIMGLRAIYRRPRASRPAPEHRVHPYLLEKVKVTGPNQVWAADITYLPMARGFLYLVAIIDCHSRYLVAWGVSNTSRSASGAGSGGGLLRRRVERGAGSGPAAGVQLRPEPAPATTGGRQFTSGEFTSGEFTSGEFTQVLRDQGVKISMDGKGRYTDNIFVLTGSTSDYIGGCLPEYYCGTLGRGFLNTIHRPMIRSMESWLLLREEIERITTTCSPIRAQRGRADAASFKSKDQSFGQISALADDAQARRATRSPMQYP